MSMLTGRMSMPRPRHAAHHAETRAPAAEHAPAAELLAAQVTIGRLEGDLRVKDAELRAAHADAQAANARATGMQAHLDARIGAIVELERDLAAARATAEGLHGQLATAREASAALEKSLGEAIAAAARPHPPHPVPPMVPAPVYDMVVTGRDVNDRPARITLTPRKAG